ncbi:MAG: outer membrane protein transport protein [Myxococcales bacterium]|nr:MAG: outer membrane protein transport protein [Myxococcales bacterium]
MSKVGLVLLGALAVARPAWAGGLEYPSPTTKGLGRGGAYLIGGNDPMGLAYNPASLSKIDGRQLAINAQLAVLSACADLAGSYGRGSSGNVPTVFGQPADFNAQELPKVCNDGLPSIVPSLVFAIRLPKGFSLAAGLLSPNALSTLKYGNSNGSIQNSDGTLLPSPTRYTLVESRLMEIWPTIGGSWTPKPWLSLGASFGWGMGFYNFTSYSAAIPGTSPANDVRTKLNTQDLFIPVLNAGINLRPFRFLEFALALRWIDSIRGGGTLDLRASDFGTNAEGGYVPHATRVDNAELQVPSRIKFSWGTRYVHFRAKHASKQNKHDSMAQELFDIELDLAYELNSTIDAFKVNVPQGNSLVIEAFGAQAVNVPVPLQTVIPYQWNNQFTAHLGGDYNLIQNLLALRLGVSFESRGVSPAYQNLTFMPAQRLGLHLGSTLRLGAWDLSVAFAHVFQETIEVSQTHAELEQVVAGSLSGSVINAGTYSAHFDIFALGANFHF